MSRIPKDRPQRKRKPRESRAKPGAKRGRPPLTPLTDPDTLLKSFTLALIADPEKRRPNWNPCDPKWSSSVQRAVCEALATNGITVDPSPGAPMIRGKAGGAAQAKSRVDEVGFYFTERGDCRSAIEAWERNPLSSGARIPAVADALRVLLQTNSAWENGIIEPVAVIGLLAFHAAICAWHEAWLPLKMLQDLANRIEIKSRLLEGFAFHACAFQGRLLHFAPDAFLLQIEGASIQ